MKPSNNERPRAEGLASLVRRSVANAAGEANDLQELERLVHAQRRASAGRTRWRPIWAAAAAIAFCAALFVARRVLRGPTAAAITLVQADVYRQGTPAGRSHYVFSDGTSLEASADSAIEVESTDAGSPRLRLTRGEAHVHVIHTPHTQWTFTAGAFEIDVVGTTFDLTWDPPSRHFAVALLEGSIALRGPAFAAPLQVRSGQTVSVTNDVLTVVPTSESVTGETTAAARGAKDASRAPADAVLPSAANQPAPELHSPQLSSPRQDPTPGRNETAPQATVFDEAARSTKWRSLVARGQFETVVAEASARPLAACLAACSPLELRALGEAARYSNRFGLAERALLALRHRFGGTAESAVAAFLLGRTFEAKHASAQAAIWYARYLSEAPSGEFAVDAAAGQARTRETR